MTAGNTHFHNPVLRYGFAIVIVAASMFLRFALTGLMRGEGYQYVTVFPAIIIVAIFAGMGPAVLCAALAAPLAEYYFTPALEFADIPAISIVVMTGFLAGALAQRLHNALAQKDRESQALSESERRFRKTFENASVGITHVDLNGNWILVNDKFCKMLGYSKETLIDTEFSVVTHPDDVMHDWETFRRLMNGEVESYIIEKRYIHKTGGIVWASLYRSLVRDQEGRPLYSATVVVDITARKLAEEEAAKLQHNIEEKNKELESIIGIVSHDLRAPLVNVRGFANEIRKDCVRAKSTLDNTPSCETALEKIAPVFEASVPESVGFIESSAAAMNNLVNSLVEVARAGLAVVKPEALDMNEIIGKVADSIKFKFKEADVSYDIDANLPACFGDRIQVTQVFTNLLDNAAKYLDQTRQGEICLSGRVQGGNAIYSVADNGIGIAPEDQEKLFNVYTQLHEKAAGGVGMGLATVKRLLDRNGGRIWILSEKDRGSTFFITLPLPPPIPDKNNP
jgi:PAS domain S-box-containing protein